MLRTQKEWTLALFLSGLFFVSSAAMSTVMAQNLGLEPGSALDSALGEPGEQPRAETESEESAEEPPEDEVGAEHMRILNKLLWGEKFTEKTGIFIAGWLDQGITGNPANPSDRFNGPLMGNDRANEYQMNQLYLYLEKPVDLESGGISVGGRFDIMYGTDSYLFQSLGWDTSICSPEESRFYDLAMPQFFVEFGIPVGNGLSAKFGHWFTLISYETGLAPYDFFYSHALGYNGTPFAHTGALFTYQLTDQLSTSHGVHRGNDVWEDNNNQMAYTGNLAWNNKNETVFLYAAVNVGPEQDENRVWQGIVAGPGEQLDRTLYSFSAEFVLTEKLRYVANHDFYYQQGSHDYNTPNIQGYGLTQYLFYDLNEKVSLGARMDVYHDDGWIVYGYRTGNATSPSTYSNLTLGMNIKQSKHLRWRPEIRWDWQDLDNPADTPAFNAGRSSTQFTFATDLVIVF